MALFEALNISEGPFAVLLDEVGDVGAIGEGGGAGEGLAVDAEGGFGGRVERIAAGTKVEMEGGDAGGLQIEAGGRVFGFDAAAFPVLFQAIDGDPFHAGVAQGVSDEFDFAGV